MNNFNYYLIPGMGADHRIYSRFNLRYGQIHHLDWLPPRKAETFEEYAVEVSERITTENNIIIGSSMGGMMAVEVSKIIQPKSTILISAPVGIHEFPRILKFTKWTRIHHVVTPAMIEKLNFLANTFMGFKDENQKKLFFEMMDKLGPEFIRFSVKALLDWKNTERPRGDLLQIVGTKDVLFDYKKMKEPILLDGGGHFSCFDRSEEISNIINTYIEANFIEKT